MLTDADRELRQQFEQRTLANAAFRHREHLRLTFGYLHEHAPAAVADRLCASLLALATSHGVGERFHWTLTVAWVWLIAAARHDYPDLGFDELVAACPWLLDKDAPLAYYSREHMYSDEARRRWVEPDLRPLPRVPAGTPAGA